MYVGVGSGNPVKVDATERAIAGDDGFGDGATVEACPVASGVAEQPRGRAETARGAQNRAAAALDEGYDLGVGIEGGVAPFETGGWDDDGSDGGPPARATPLGLIMDAAVTDGTQWGRGTGPTLVLPAGIADRIRAGEELGPVMDDTLGEENVARRQGAAGALTGGRVDRTDALATAVAAALGPFVTDLYDV